MINKSNEKLFTVIIAVYNEEKRIIKCLDSLTNQSNIDFNIIVVNDGSKDNTSEEITKYITKNKKNIDIKYIDKIQNQGVSSARNDALKLVKTKYVFFLDSDDYFDLDVIENYINIVNKYNFDFYSFNYIAVYSDTAKNKVYTSIYNEDKTFNSNEFVNELLMQKNGIYAHCCTKIYKTQIIKENNIKFENKVSFMEDLIFNLKYAIKCRNIVHINKYWYNYVQSENSLSKSNDEKMINNFKLVLEEVLNILNSSNILESHINEYKSMYNRLVLIAIKTVAKSDKIDELKKLMIKLIYETFDVENKLEILEDKYYFNVMFNEITKEITCNGFDLDYITEKVK